MISEFKCQVYYGYLANKLENELQLIVIKIYLGNCIKIIPNNYKIFWEAQLVARINNKL